MVPTLLQHMPESYGTYFEPFIGSGALFFALKPRRAIISDMNLRLVLTYQAIRDDVEAVCVNLDAYTASHSPEFYAAHRNAYQGRELQTPAAEIAAWFLYVNKTSFNGLYRVNRSGIFNVPLDPSKDATFDKANLRACSRALQGIDILHGDFRAMESYAQTGDVAFFDPPYVPVTKTSSFTAYAKDPFGPTQQGALRDLAYRLKLRGVHVLLTNSSADLVRQLYSQFTVSEVPMRRNVNRDASKRGAVMELLIR